MAPLTINPHDPAWAEHYTQISTLLHTYLNATSIPHTIEHIGSTSIPHLAAKPNIDIAIIVPNALAATQAKDALIWQPTAAEHYKCIGNGGIKGRISMKFHNYNRVPYRSVYIIHKDDEDGMLGLRGYRDVKRMLTGDGPQARVLRREYEDVKWEILNEGVTDGVEYGRRKNGVIRKILLLAGWTEEEVERKEALDVREPWEVEDLY